MTLFPSLTLAVKMLGSKHGFDFFAMVAGTKPFPGISSHRCPPDSRVFSPDGVRAEIEKTTWDSTVEVAVAESTDFSGQKARRCRKRPFVPGRYGGAESGHERWAGRVTRRNTSNRLESTARANGTSRKRIAPNPTTGSRSAHPFGCAGNPTQPAFADQAIQRSRRSRSR